MVASGLVDDPHVSHYRLATHLGIAVAIYGALVWTGLGLDDPAPRPERSPGLAAGALAVAGLVFLTILSGALVAGLHAGLIDNTFPMMEGRIVPPDYLARGIAADAILSNPTAVQFNHRLLAVTAVAAALGFALLASRRAAARVARLPLALMAAMAVIQAGLGIATLLLLVPVALAAVHQAGALVLFGLAVWSARRLAG
jgi:cytochrome c oxidase assembly protein subunit 15